MNRVRLLENSEIIAPPLSSVVSDMRKIYLEVTERLVLEAAIVTNVGFASQCISCGHVGIFKHKSTSQNVKDPVVGGEGEF